VNEDDPLWVYRLPVAGTVACLLLVAGFWMFVVFILPDISTRGTTGGILTGVFVTLAWLRLAVMTVVAFPDHLVVRNYWGTHRIRRRSIRGFEVVTSSVNPIRPTVRVLTTDEPVEIDVMMATLPGERGAAAVEARRARLQEWLARGPVGEPVTGLD
jgi:hypothetical protein